MATFKAVVLKHQKRGDGTYPVSIRVTHNRLSAYIATQLYIEQSGIAKRSFEIKDSFVIERTNNIIRTYTKSLCGIDSNTLLCMSTTDLKMYLQSLTSTIDFVAFGMDLAATKKPNTKSGYISALNYIRLLGYDSLSVTLFTSHFIRRYMDCMQRHGVSANVQRAYIMKLNSIFNSIKRAYNTEFVNVVSHNPFYNIQLPEKCKPFKRTIDIDLLRDILLGKIECESKCKFLLDMCAASFFLCGTNFADLYYLRKADVQNGRLLFCRQKTKDRRVDNAFVSMPIVPELQAIIERYADGSEWLFPLHKCGGQSSVVGSVNAVLRKLFAGKRISTYSFRRGWATIARNKCGVSKDDIDECLNHIGANPMADEYIDKDWSVIDRTCRKVLDFVLVRRYA